MLTQERHSRILEIIKNKGSVTVSELCEIFNASESTIRRDLAALTAVGKINKVRGGAMLLSQEFLNIEENINKKVNTNYNEKFRIAEYAASLIQDEDYVFIDAGSTTFLLATMITNTKATYVTNGIAQAQELAAKGCHVIVLGGDLKKSTEAITGVVAAQNLQKYNFSKAFIGVNGATEKQGFTTTDIEEATIKAVAIERSFVSYVLADSSKFGKVSAVSIAPIDSSSIICDKCSDNEIKTMTVVKEVAAL
ncbi:MAG: DeoR/GlpR transcriptional regulator [Eubacterium sp.]|nr:DeoR/GlpR transcriptional regulator [Eubacterium sp.]